MSIIGNSTTPVILNPGTPNVTLAGDINAYGALVGVVTQSPAGVIGTIDLDGAVGGVGAAFDVTNTGIVETSGNAPLATAIILGAPGIVKNTGTIEGGSGIIMFGKAPDGYVRNTGLIDARKGAGVYLYGGGGVSNTGKIFGALDGVDLGGAGGLANAGSIAGATGVSATYSAVAITNSGQVDGFATYGIALDGSLANNPGAIIEGTSAAVYLTTGAIYNRGQIGEGGTIGIKIGNGAQLRNTGAIQGNFAAIDGSQSAGISTALYNAATGRITGNVHAVLLFGAYGAYANIANAGYIEGGAFASSFDDFTAGLYNAGNVAILMQAGRLINTGTISGGNTGILMATGPGTVINDGLIKTTGIARPGPTPGIYLRGGGQVTNAGQIIGGVTFGAAGALSNSGLISGSVKGTALNLFNTGTMGGALVYSGSSIGNAGTINDGVRIDGTGIIVNTGTILSGTPRLTDISGYYGIYVLDTGTITNTGLIDGVDGGIVLRAGGTVIDSGIITATSGHDALVFERGFTNRLILDPSADIAGPVILNGTLELAAGATTGTLNIGRINEATAVTIDAGAIWKLSGAAGKATTVFNDGILRASSAHTAAGPVYNYSAIKGGNGIIAAGGYVYNSGIITATSSSGTGIALTAPGYIINAAGAAITGATGIDLAAHDRLYNDGQITGGITAATTTTIDNTGTITERPGTTIAIAGTLTGPGTIELSTGPVTLAGPVTAQHIAFTAQAETLTLTDPTAFAGSMQNFALADTIDLSTIPLAAITGTQFSNGVLTLTESSLHLTFTFANQAAFATETFALFADGAGTGITLAAAASASASPAPAWLNLTCQSPAIALPQIVTLHP